MEKPDSLDIDFDVAIIGGGPVGLLMAYQLLRFSGGRHSVYIVDKDDKSLGGDATITTTTTAATTTETEGEGRGEREREAKFYYGRANAIYSRSAELLDQLDLAHDLVQQSHICRQSYTYDEHGNRVVPGRVWNFVENIEDTFFDFAIMLRQQYIERSFREHLARLGVTLRDRTECVDFSTPQQHGGSEDLIHTTLRDLRSGTEYTIKSKYLLGADGGRSFVRRKLNVAFEGDTTLDKWIRIDGRIKTDLPHPRAYGSIQSPTHGNVLWAPLDHECTRIGYVFTAEQEQRCNGNLTQEVAVQEAIAAMKPFRVEFESVEWWTLYIVGQRIASTYRPHPRILLVGDACHTHSSGAAQGLNTGIYDAINLGWKLSLTLKGLARDDILLQTYDLERRSAAQRLIAFDQKISALMANKWPKDMERDESVNGRDINAVLAGLFDDAAGLNLGLRLSYDPNLLNQLPEASTGNTLCSIVPGSRAPDVGLIKPGTLETTRLYSIIPNMSCLYVVAFVGDPRVTLPRIASFASYLGQEDRSSLKHRFSPAALQFVTIVSTSDLKLGAQEALGVPPFSHVYFDDRRAAHRRYGISLREGALLVVRPDGILGLQAELSDKGGEAVAHYLSRFMTGPKI